MKVDLRSYGISRAQAFRLRAAFATFDDWNAPEMNVYDNYDAALAAFRAQQVLEAHDTLINEEADCPDE